MARGWIKPPSPAGEDGEEVPLTVARKHILAEAEKAVIAMLSDDHKWSMSDALFAGQRFLSRLTTQPKVDERFLMIVDVIREAQLALRPGSDIAPFANKIIAALDALGEGK